MAKVLLKGSERSTLPGARVVAPANPTERLEVSVLVRRRGKQAMQSRLAAIIGGKEIAHLSREDFAREHGADPADFAKVHAFVDAPPNGIQKVSRSNGDALLYDAKTNTFAVVTKAGAPRTMFKPRDGASYWQQQVSREQSRASGNDKSDS